MPKRALTVSLALVLLLAGIGWLGQWPSAGPSGEAPGIGAAQLAAQKTFRGKCRGLYRRQVIGDEPTYTRKKLAKFRNHRAMCRGVWLPSPRRYLVPQGIAVTGKTAWVSGFRYRKTTGNRPCQLVRISLRTGRRLELFRAIYGQVGKRPRTYCRHGGGLLQRGKWLWIVEKNKLWRVDPNQSGRWLEADRVWRLKSPVRGSTVVATTRRIGMVPYAKSGKPRIRWYPFKALMRPGVLDLGVRSAGRKQLGAAGTTRIPRLVQGATVDARGRLYLSRSNLACGELVTPRGRRIAFIPGAEGLQFTPRGTRLWVVSESGAWPYAKSRKPFTPAVTGFEFPRLLRGKAASCGFPRY